eukprot:IDg16398t1
MSGRRILSTLARAAPIAQKHATLGLAEAAGPARSTGALVAAMQQIRGAHASSARDSKVANLKGMQPSNKAEY